jgi:hypothetical protein
MVLYKIYTVHNVHMGIPSVCYYLAEQDRTNFITRTFPGDGIFI